MKMKTNNFFKRLLALCLTLLILLPTNTYAWTTDDLTSTTWPYLIGWTGGKAADYGKFFSLKDSEGRLYSRETMSFGVGPLVRVAIPEGGSATFSPASFYSDYAGKNMISSTTFTCQEILPADHSSPVLYTATAADGREYPFYIIAEPAQNNSKNTDEEVNEIIDYLVEPLTNLFRAYSAKLEAMYQARSSGSLAVGDYQPVQFNMLYQTARAIGLATASSAENYPDGGVVLFEYHDWNSADAEDVMRKVLEYDAYNTRVGGDLRRYSKAYYQALVEVAAPYYLDFVENNRITEPAIDRYAVGDSVGVVDTASKTVTIRFPQGTDLTNLPAPTIELSDWLKVSQVAGSLKSGKVVYNITPWEKTVGIVYDGVSTIDEYGFDMGADLSAYWTVVVEEGDPYTVASAFSVTTADGVTRYGKIDEENGTITLNLPVGTDLTAISPTITHTGTHTNMDSGTFDFSGGKTQTLTVYNRTYELERSYTVTITAEASSQNSIESYSIGDAIGAINSDTGVVEITIPYATDLVSVQPEIVISEFATLKSAPDGLSEGDNEYVIAAENGVERTWTVKITRTPAAKGNNILSFRYGSVQGIINNNTGEITMELPAGTATSFAPVIEVSPFATVSPASGVKQDFSKTVTYVVTAENGNTNTYNVNVSFTGAVAENEYKDDLQNVVNKIITRYSSTADDDWEWMNLGFYQGKLANYDGGYDLAGQIADLDTTTSVAMTNIARTIMMLTARGFDCSNLAQYNDGQPFIDSKGNEVDNLAATMYNYAGTYTINGPIFGLISLDMGNYTIPDNAIWTRDAFMDVILNHVYLSDGFDTDMVAMLMQSIAPYANDEVYGERVRAKLEEGVSIIITRMNADYSFKAWGAVNSETAAQVICALSAMGIDCHTDPRFSDGQGKSVIQSWVDSFVNPSGYFHHTTSVINNAMATYQGCYASQWYLNFLEAGGTGHPYSLYNRRFDFARQLSTDASITGFEIEGKQGIITEGGEGGENTITVTVPNGMPLTNLTPTVTMAEGATLLAPSLPVTFVEGIKQPFTVMAEDGKTTKTYNVTVTHGDVGASGAELDVNSIKLQNSVLNVTDILEKKVTKASDGATEILLTVGAGVDTSKMYLSASISYKATSDPSLDGKDAMNFSDWQTFTVTSGDETVKNVYRIKVVSKTQAEITSFRVQAAGEWYNGVIDNTKSTITVTGVDDSKLTSTKLVTDIEFTGRSCSPTSGIAVDFANAATFTLGGDNDLASRTYTVTVLNKSGQPISAKSSGGDDDTPVTSTAKITGFSVLGVEGEIDQSAGTITVKLPVGTNVTAVAPVVTVPAGAVVSPVSGEVVNLTSPLTYTVTLGAESRNYTVTVIFERSISQQLWDKVAENSDVADHQTSYGHHFK